MSIDLIFMFSITIKIGLDYLFILAMIIRGYKPRDLEACANLILDTSKKYNKDDIIPWKEDEFFGFFDYENNREKVEKFFSESNVILAENDRWEIVWILRYEHNRIKSFFVSDKYMHQWIWKTLFEKYKKDLIDDWFKFVTLFSSTYWIRFYESLWFEITWDRVLRWDAIYSYPMRLLLE